MEIKIAESDSEIMECFPVIYELRPQLKKGDFVNLIRELNKNHNYQLVYLKDTVISSVMGIRIGLWLHTGKYLEIEDLITTESARSKGHGEKLLDWAKKYGKSQSCNQLRLVSGVSREKAHKFYKNNGMLFEAKYFSIDL
jgi:GNAT superfamily N-acetyltransferase